MKLQNTKGFTLIELLVVITIIGILATGATVTYTSQIQKARDTTRMGDIKALQIAAEQVYQDRTEYPPSSTYFYKDEDGGGVAIGTYLQKIPKDPKNGQTCNNGGVPPSGPTCVYTYTVKQDDNGINKGCFVLSTAFESQGKVTTDAKKDGGKVDVRWEVGNGLSQSDILDIGLTPYNETIAGNLKTGTGIRDNSGAVIETNNWEMQGTTITINGS